jgi:outer membrane protein, heavy metal efflux system
MRIHTRRVARRIVPATRACALAAATSLIALSHSVMAQAGPASLQARETTHLADLYSMVERDNPKVTAARSLARAAEARVPGAKRPPDPQLQFGFMNYTLPDLRPMELIGMPQLQLMQMLPLGGKLSLAGRVAGAQAASTGERAHDVIWELRSRTAMAFYDLYATDRQLDVAHETLRLLQDIARTAESMYRVGEGRQADVLRAQVEIARMVEDTLRMQAMRQTMVARLNALLNRDVAITVPTPAIPAFPDTVPARSWLDSLGTSGRPMIRAGLEDVRAADASAALARRELVPDLQVGVQYGRASMLPTTDASGAVMPGKTENMGSLMIGASIPIFARDRQLQMRNEAEAMKAMAQADVASMRADTRGRIGEAYADLMRARHLASLYRTTVLPQAEATAASAQAAYRGGTVDFMTLLDDRMRVNKYRQELSTLEADEGKAWAELEMLTGRELIDANSIATAARATPDLARESAKRGVR